MQFKLANLSKIISSYREVPGIAEIFLETYRFNVPTFLSALVLCLVKTRWYKEPASPKNPAWFLFSSNLIYNKILTGEKISQNLPEIYQSVSSNQHLPSGGCSGQPSEPSPLDE